MKAYKTFDRKTVGGNYVTKPGSKEYFFMLGVVYENPGLLQLCSSGFHYHTNLTDVFNYKDKSGVVCEIDVLGEMVCDIDKCATNRFKIVREIGADELNTGVKNTGIFNTGDRNTDDRNTGFFNTSTPETINIFNRPCDIGAWNNAYKPLFLFFNTTEFVIEADMSEEERSNNPSYKTTGGFLRKYNYKDAFKLSWDRADKMDRIRVKELPNFDKDIFFEISGIDVDKD